MDCSKPGVTVLLHLLEFAQTLTIELVMPSNHLKFLCVSSFSSCLQSFPASGSFPIGGSEAKGSPTLLFYWPQNLSSSIIISNIVFFGALFIVKIFLNMCIYMIHKMSHISAIIGVVPTSHSHREPLISIFNVFF